MLLRMPQVLISSSIGPAEDIPPSNVTNLDLKRRTITLNETIYHSNINKMQFSQSLIFTSMALFSLGSCAPTPVDKAPDAPAPTTKWNNIPDQHTCLSTHRYDPKDYDGWEFECFQNSDCGGGAQKGCHCIIEAVERFDPSLGDKGLPYYNKAPKCVFIPTVELLLGIELADGSPSLH
ncbi:hypothetical protein TWF506_004513 [Arthrobotrys conoides]|uniref:Uncharacterized protein n=1 Tax=Arthrobotrys conoides TaxID=74498 RepID=A0AAN8NFV1_9PEZI